MWTPRRSTSTRPASIAPLRTAKRLGLKPKIVIPVDLFALLADHDAISAVAKSAGLYVLDDVGHSRSVPSSMPGSSASAPATATSFFPAKPLGSGEAGPSSPTTTNSPKS